MIALIALAGAFLAAVTLTGFKSKEKATAKFGVGDCVQMKVGSDGRMLTVLERSLETGGWHYQVGFQSNPTELPTPGAIGLTWWTAENNLVACPPILDPSLGF